MARRRRKNRDLQLIEALVPLLALYFFYPGQRSAGWSAFGILLSLAAIFGLGLIGILLFRVIVSRLPFSRCDTIAATAVGAETPGFVAIPSIPKSVSAKSVAREIDLTCIDWFQFEKLVALAYSRTHRVTRKGGANPDGGIDLIIENASGKTAVQCKHWKTWKVGVKVVRELIGAMADAGLQRGLIITLKGYSTEAVSLAERHGIKLLGEQEIRTMLNGVDEAAAAAIFRDARKYCPKCESEMVLRTAGRGKNVGGQFWGCSRYPACRETMKYETTPLETWKRPLAAF